MRVAFMGKGGSGKTTLAASFITYLTRYKQEQLILAIDADVNRHLQRALEITGEMTPLSARAGDIFAYLEGEREEWQRLGLPSLPTFGSIPPSHTSRFISLQRQDAFLHTYALMQDGMALCTVGTHQHEDVSNTCYHNKLNVLEAVLHHLLDTERDFVVADSTAGIDNLGTSLFMAYDLTIFVVEPTRKSLRVYQEYVQQLQRYPLQVKALINKVRHEDDKRFVQEHIAEEAIVGYIPYSEHLKAFEQGKLEARHLFIQEHQGVWEMIVAALRQHPRDWTAYQHLLQRLFAQECQSWWNQYSGKDLTTILSPTFRYQNVLKQEVRV